MSIIKFQENLEVICSTQIMLTILALASRYIYEEVVALDLWGCFSPSSLYLLYARLLKLLRNWYLHNSWLRAPAICFIEIDHKSAWNLLFCVAEAAGGWGIRCYGKKWKRKWVEEQFLISAIKDNKACACQELICLFVLLWSPGTPE